MTIFESFLVISVRLFGSFAGLSRLPTTTILKVPTLNRIEETRMLCSAGHVSLINVLRQSVPISRLRAELGTGKDSNPAIIGFVDFSATHIHSACVFIKAIPPIRNT